MFRSQPFHHIIDIVLICILATLVFNCSFDSDGTDIKEFDINVVVLTNNPIANETVNIEAAKNEIEILNTHFVTEQKRQIARFKLKTFYSYNDIKNSQCEFIKIGDTTKQYVSKYWQNLFNMCDDKRVVDPSAINFYIYDSYSSKKGFSDKTGHGKNNHDKPYILLDWERLNHRIQSPEEHEMGHAFGLVHECAPGATKETSTNIMASKECGKGSGGKRDIGFNAEQVKIIERNASEIARKLKTQ